MSILSRVTKGRVVQPNLWLVYGVNGVGKSSLGAEGPSPIFIGPESGTANLNVNRIATSNYAEVLEVLKSLLNDKHDFQTAVIDSLDWLEPLLWQHVIDHHNTTAKHPVESIEDFGYGKGYVYALDEWRNMIRLVSKLRDQKGMHVILVAHPQVKAAKDPTVITDYDRYQLKLNDKAAALWKEFVDCVFFINYETLVAASKKPEGKGKAVGLDQADRYIYTEWTSAYDAKNRFGLAPKIPYEKGLGWKTLTDAIAESNPDTPEVARHNIDLLLEQVEDEKLRNVVRETADQAAKDRDMPKLERIFIKLRTILNAA